MKFAREREKIEQRNHLKKSGSLPNKHCLQTLNFKYTLIKRGGTFISQLVFRIVEVLTPKSCLFVNFFSRSLSGKSLRISPCQTHLIDSGTHLEGFFSQTNSSP